MVRQGRYIDNLLTQEGHIMDMDESMFPFFFSCPLGYLDKVPIDQYGGNHEWREGVRDYHARQKAKQRTPAKVV